jgi:thiol-disulfide isomerase/thioredoxin
MKLAFIKGLMLTVALSSLPQVSAFQATNQSDSYTELRKAIQESDPQEALKQFMAAVEADPADMRTYSLSSMMASRLYSAGKIADAVECLDQICGRLEQQDPSPASANALSSTVGALQAYARRLDQEGTAERVAGRITSALGVVRKAAAADAEGAYSLPLSRLISAQVSSLRDQEDTQGAIALLTTEAEAFKSGIDSADTTENAIRAYSSLIQQQISMTADASAGDRLRAELEAAFATALKAKQDSPLVMSEFIRFRLSQASGLSRERPDDATRLLADLSEIVSKSSVAESPVVVSSMRSLASLERRIASARLLLEMIGKPAPEFDYGTTAHGDPVTAESLRGKVLLIDFWAVWCGPCIATFPHLNALHDEFHEKGLEIVGVTRQYNYQWNEEAGRASRSQEEVTLDDELVMLGKFMDSHELRHATVVVPKESQMHSSFGVTGIPHAVVIDREGIVRLVKVGSGEANAEAIHAEIARLIEN